MKPAMPHTRAACGIVLSADAVPFPSVSPWLSLFKAARHCGLMNKKIPRKACNRTYEEGIAMLVYLNGSKITDHSRLHQGSKNVLCIAEKQEQAEFLPKLFPDHGRVQGKETSGNYFESHRDFDYFFIKVPHVKGLNASASAAEIFFSADKLVFLFAKGTMMDGFIHALENDADSLQTLENVLYFFFVKLTETDADKLVKIEKEIISMEDALVPSVDKGRDYEKPIRELRRRLFALKRYYESLVDMFEDMEENRNHFLSDAALNRLHFHANRVDRLYHDVLNLREYAMQVREAYQSQMDITLNKTMRFFTVIATIFLPLTLVVGWYGMNIKMPEYQNEYAYPIVIIACAVIVVASILYFKKKKWF